MASVLESFVINLPMTGKSGGDGFWVHQSGDNFYIVLFDCMGHGHLASMMTRVYNQTIQKIIKEDHIDDPGTILRYLHHRISAKFDGKKQQQIGPNADVAVVKINLAVRRVEYSGAKIDLIQICSGECNVIKADRLPIGDMLHMPHNYETKLVDLNSKEPSNFYLSSDGFKDLMGGGGLNKLGSKQALELLKANHSKHIYKQKDEILKGLMHWQGASEPLDDLLLIGFAV